MMTCITYTITRLIEIVNGASGEVQGHFKCSARYWVLSFQVYSLDSDFSSKNHILGYKTFPQEQPVSSGF